MKLTIVVPTYNRSDLLARALSGLLDQTTPPEDYEIVVVDDGSTDATPEVLASVNAPETRFCHFSQQNKGPAAARNLGIKQACGEIILFTGDDCLPDRRLVEEHLRAHDQQNDIGVIGHISWHPELEITPFMAFLEQGAQFGFGKIKDPKNVPAWFFYTANCSIRKNCLVQVGGFDEDFKYAAFEDVELAYRMQKKGLRLIYHPQARTYHHHATTLEQHLKRQMVCGRSAVLLWRKHPELKVEVGITHSARLTTALKLYEAASEYAFALGVRAGMKGEEPASDEELQALWGDLQLAEAGRNWVHEIFGTLDPDKVELIKLRAELHNMKQEWDRVTQRRLYRWSEALAHTGWSVLRGLGLRKKAGAR